MASGGNLDWKRSGISPGHARDDCRYARPADRMISQAFDNWRGPAMRIVSILAPALLLAGVAAAAAQATSAPVIKLALFPFELEDVSAGAGTIPPDGIDREQLRLSTEEAHRLIAASGRYQLVDVGAVSDRSAGNLRHCEGCEAKLAAGLDADQSMIGIVTRI